MEQKENSDKIVREQLAQSLQAQSALKAELAQAIQRYEVNRFTITKRSNDR